MHTLLDRPNMMKRFGLAGSVFLILALYVLAALPAAAIQPGNQHFQGTWQRTDRPVMEGWISRTWMWGPEAFTDVLQESYADSPGGERSVQYFDKSRMEITNPDAASGSIWYVTNGLLVVELISGNMQVGDDTFEQRSPAEVNVAGDADDPTGPTYASFSALLDDPAQAMGGNIIARVDRAGDVSSDPSLAAQGVTVGYVDDVTSHAIATPFWDFMNSSGSVYQNGQVISAPLFESAFFATGRPITEAYWANVKVGGQYRDVLMQCFERRCMTYTPGNPAGFIVEAGNVGQHYYSWRYAEVEDPSEELPVDEPPANVPPQEEPPADEPPLDDPDPTPEPELPLEPEPATEYEHVLSLEGGIDLQYLSNPTGVALAPNGDVYVVELTDKVHRFTRDGFWVKTWGREGADSGHFDNPQGITIDHEGNVYVADYLNHRIQKFDPDGAFITAIPIDGFPIDVALDPEMETLYIVDQGNHQILRYSLVDGDFRSPWGAYGSEPGQLFIPGAIAIDDDGNVFIADTGNNRVQMFSPAGELLSAFGSKGAGPGEFHSPNGIAITAQGEVLVADEGNHRIQIFTYLAAVTPIDRGLQALGPVYTYLDEFGTHGNEDGQFDHPESLAIDEAGNVLVADSRNARIQEFDGDYQHLDSWYDGHRGRVYEFEVVTLGPNGDRLDIVDPDLKQIKRFTLEGEFIEETRDTFTFGLAYDSQGNAFISDRLKNLIQKYSPAGELLLSWGRSGPGNGEFKHIYGIAIDADDNVYVADSGNYRIQKFTSDGQFITAWGRTGNQPGEFGAFVDLTIHGDLIFVADRGYQRVQVFDLDGNFVRQWGGYGAGEGQFDAPIGIAVDHDGYVYVTELNNRRIQKFTSTGEFVTQFGDDGIGPGLLSSPVDITVGDDGTVYVADRAQLEIFKPVN